MALRKYFPLLFSCSHLAVPTLLESSLFSPPEEWTNCFLSLVPRGVPPSFFFRLNMSLVTSSVVPSFLFRRKFPIPLFFPPCERVPKETFLRSRPYTRPPPFPRTFFTREGSPPPTSLLYLEDPSSIGQAGSMRKSPSWRLSSGLSFFLLGSSCPSWRAGRLPLFLLLRFFFFFRNRRRPWIRNSFFFLPPRRAPPINWRNFLSRFPPKDGLPSYRLSPEGRPPAVPSPSPSLGVNPLLVEVEIFPLPPRRFSPFLVVAQPSPFFCETRFFPHPARPSVCLPPFRQGSFLLRDAGFL